MVMNRLAVALLIIAQTAKNPTPIIVAALSSKVHNPLTLTPQRLRISSAANSQTIPFITRVKPSSDSSDSESRYSRPRMDPAMSRVIKETVMKAATMTITVASTIITLTLLFASQSIDPRHPPPPCYLYRMPAA